MKDSGVEWIGNIPDKWRIGKVKQVFRRIKAKAGQEEPVVLSLARSGIKRRDISNNEGQLAESYYNYNPVQVGDLLINPMDLYSGANCNVSKVEGVISPAYANLRAKGHNDSKYYDYYFKTQYWAMALFAHGKGVSFDNRWTLNNETLMNYFIPIPLTSEQKKIADFLDQKVSEIDHIIEKNKLSIEEYKKYKQSLITETVTKGLNKNAKMKDSGVEWIGGIPEHWGAIRLKCLFDLNTGLTITKSELKLEGISCLNYGDIHSKYTFDIDLNRDALPKADEKLVLTRPNTLVSNGDFVFCDTSEDLEGSGNFAFIRNRSGEKICAGSHTVVAKPKQDFNSPYMGYLLKSKGIKSQIEQNVSGIKVYSITQTILKKVVLILPPKEEQEQMSMFLDSRCSEIDRIIYQKTKLIPELESYKKSLIFESVTGKREVV